MIAEVAMAATAFPRCYTKLEDNDEPCRDHQNQEGVKATVAKGLGQELS